MTCPYPTSPRQTAARLRPPQFRLRTLLIVVTLCAVLLALQQWFDPVVLFALAFFALTVAFHVAGNAIGTRLREIGNQPTAPDEKPVEQRRLPPRPHEFAPTTPLGRRHSLGLAIIIATSVGITSGAIGGGLWTFAATRGQIAAVNILVGVVAFGVLGGFAAFAVAAFAQVLGGAIWQAMKPPPGCQLPASPADRPDVDSQSSGPVRAASNVVIGTNS